MPGPTASWLRQRGLDDPQMMTAATIAACAFYLASGTLLIALEVRLPRGALVWRTVSAYALGAGRAQFDRYGVLMIAGVLSQALAAALHGGLGPAMPLSMLALAVCLAGLLAYPTDSERVTRGTSTIRALRHRGAVHMRYAIGAFLLVGVTVALGQARMPALASGALLAVLDVLASGIALMLAAVAATGLVARWHGGFGLAERALIYLSALWFLSVALLLGVTG